MPIRSATRALFIAGEGAFDTQNTTDAEYMPVKTSQSGLGEIEFLDEFSGMNYAVGLPRATREERLRGGASIPCEIVWTPYGAGAVSDGGAVPVTLDALDLALQSALGTVITRAGEGVVSVSGTTATLDTAVYTVGDILALYEAGVNNSRTQIRLTRDRSAAAYTIDASGAAFTGAAISPGYREFRSHGEDGASLSAYFQDDDLVYELSGGIYILESITFEAGGLVLLQGSFRFNTIVYVGAAGGGAIIPTTVASGVIIEYPVKAELGVCHFDGTDYSGLVSATLNLNPQVIWEPGLDGTNGRVGQRNLTNYATLECTFPANAAFRTAMSAENTGLLRLMIGSGTIGSGRLNGLAWGFQEAQILASGRNDDGGRARQSVNFKIVHAGRIGSTTPTVVPFFSLTRF